MRVAFVTHYGDYQYGANRSLVDLIDGLQACGLEMLVIAPRAGSLASALERRGITVICHHYGWWMSPGRSKLRASARMLRGGLNTAPLARELRSWNCDIIHSNSSVTPIGWLLAAANFTFCILGLISPVKGQVEAIRAFARVAAKYENVSLLVAGYGEEEVIRSCAALVDRLGLRGKVKFTGYVADPFPLLAQVDAVLVCSKVEAMGRVSAEAMAAGKPMVGTRLY